MAWVEHAKRRLESAQANKRQVRSKYFTDIDVDVDVLPEDAKQRAQVKELRSKYFTELDVSPEKTKVSAEKAPKCSKDAKRRPQRAQGKAVRSKYFTEPDVSTKKAKLSNGKRLRKGLENRLKKLKQEKFEVKHAVEKSSKLVAPAWDPPVSPYGLVQEKLYTDPWKMLIACMLLNRTTGRQMYKVIGNLFELCPNPEAAIAVETEQIEEVIRSLGLQRKRAKMIQRFSQEYLHEDWTDVSQLPGIGKYAADAYKIFFEGRWTEVKPADHMLNKYWTWLHGIDSLGNAFTQEFDA